MVLDCGPGFSSPVKYLVSEYADLAAEQVDLVVDLLDLCVDLLSLLR